MPYGISKKVGGDSPANDAKVEHQVAAMQGRGIGKVSAIKIAKSMLDKQAHKHIERRKR